jgi:acetyl esterase/lipase
MKRLIALAVLVGTLTACAKGAAPKADAAPAPPVVAVTDTANYDPMSVNTVPSDPPTARIPYGSASARQYGELRVPKGKGPFPLAVLYHGGCWAGMGGTANFAALASFLAQNGIATWSPSYRELGSDGGWPNTFTDWAQGLAYVKTLARDYPLDLTRITLMGHSAGVTPAVWLASGDRGDAVIKGELPKVRGVVALDGPLALEPFVGVDAAICGQPVIAPLMGGSPAELPGRYAMLDPVTNPPLAERLLVIDGALPDPDPARLEALRKRGIAVEVIRVDQQQHFNLLVPGTADFAAIAPALLDIAKAR